MKISKLSARIPLLVAFATGWHFKPPPSASSDTLSLNGQKALEATVVVETNWKTGDDSTVFQKGTGAIIAPNGWIVTNYHNIGEARHIEVSLHDGSRYLAKVIAVERRYDLVLLKINTKGLQYFRLGNSELLHLGEPVFAIGNPGKLDYSLTSGIVSALNRSIGAIKDPQAIEQFIQTDAVMNPGSSGGPLLNSKGELIGINTAILSSSERFEGYAFAQPVEMIKELLNKVGNNIPR